MASFQYLRDKGGFALTPQHNHSCAVARERVQIAAAASRHTPTTPFLIASDRNIKN
jgi:hypothetical protein